MSNEINLLYTKRQGNPVRLSAKVRLYRMIALGLLSLTGFASVVVLLLVLASPLPGLKRQENVLLTDLAKENSKILKLTLISQRLSDVASIINKRDNADATMALFRKDVPASATIKSFSVNAKTVSITLISQDLNDIETYNKALITLTKEKKIASKVVLNDLSLSPKQPFEASYTITLL